ncbi:MAG TPA: lytic transglycosylase domain-containing protein [Acidimicrobiia bacterium]
MAGAPGRRRARRALVGSLLALGVAAAAAPAGAQVAPGPPPPAPPVGDPATPPTAPADGAGLLPGLDSRLVGVPLEYGPSSDEVVALQEAEARLAALTQEQTDLHARQVDIDQRIAVLDEMQRQAVVELEAAESERRRLTALVYAKGGTAWQAAALLQTEDAMEAERVSQLGEDFSTALRAAILRSKIARRRASAEAARLAVERVAVDERLVAVEEVELPDATREVAVLRVQSASSVAGGEVAGLDIPLATLDAYLRAQGTLALERPECGLEWWMLAGIGRVESNHGRYGGTQLGANGDTAPRIIGIPLDGRPGVATIADSDGGMWDGDPVFDHAVGPMQFIPGTWRRYAADGNGDGTQDPHNVYDVAVAAGRYLCNAAGHLGDDGTLTSAYLSYNHSDTYAAHVLYLAREYESIGLPKAVG